MHQNPSFVPDHILPMRSEPYLSSFSSPQSPMISYSFLQGRHQLRFWLPHPTQEQIEALLRAPFEMALVLQREFFILLCRFGTRPWMMTSFQWHHIPLEKRERPDLWNPVLLEILFLDAETDQSLASRTVVCGPEFTASLCGAILMQTSTRWGGEGAYEHALHQFQQQYPTPDRLVPLATARTLDIPA